MVFLTQNNSVKALKVFETNNEKSLNKQKLQIKQYVLGCCCALHGCCLFIESRTFIFDPKWGAVSKKPTKAYISGSRWFQ